MFVRLTLERFGGQLYLYQMVHLLITPPVIARNGGGVAQLNEKARRPRPIICVTPPAAEDCRSQMYNFIFI